MNDRELLTDVVEKLCNVLFVADIGNESLQLVFETRAQADEAKATIMKLLAGRKNMTEIHHLASRSNVPSPRQRVLSDDELERRRDQKDVYPKWYVDDLHDTLDKVANALGLQERNADKMITLANKLSTRQAGDETASMEALKQLRDAFLGTSIEVQADALRHARNILEGKNDQGA